MPRQQLTAQQVEKRSRRFLTTMSYRNKGSDLSPKTENVAQRGNLSRRSSEQSVRSFSSQNDITKPTHQKKSSTHCVPGWYEYYDPHAETIYYYNQKSGVALWDCPKTVRQQKQIQTRYQTTSTEKQPPQQIRGKPKPIQQNNAFIIPSSSLQKQQRVPSSNKSGTMRYA